MSSKYTTAILFLILAAAGLCQSAKNLDSLESELRKIDRNNLKKIVSEGEKLVGLSDSYEQKFAVYSYISEAFFNQNKVDQSINYLFKARQVAENAHDPKLSAQAYGSIANQYSYLNLTEKARSYLDLAEKEIEKLPEGGTKHKFRALRYLELGNLDFNEKDYLSANASYKKSLSEFDKVKKSELSLYHYRRSLYNIGNSYYYLKASDSAENYLNRALLVNDAKNPGLVHYIKATLAEVYAQKQDYKRAIDTLQAVLKDTSFRVNALKTEIYLNLAQNYKSIGDNANYAAFNDKYIELKNEVNSQDLKAINTAFSAEQQTLASKISESEAQKRWLAALAVMLVFGIGFSVYAMRKRKLEALAYKSILEKLQKRETSISEENTDQDEPQLADEPRYSISASVEKAILDGLDRFESEMEFRDPEITLPNLATKLKSNPAYVSAVIRQHRNSNFNAYINELRIRYICTRISENPEYLNYKISYLAEDSGFVSHSAFSTIFKKVTGIAPSSFIRQAKKSQLAKIGSKSAAQVL